MHSLPIAMVDFSFPQGKGCAEDTGFSLLQTGDPHGRSPRLGVRRLAITVALKCRSPFLVRCPQI